MDLHTLPLSEYVTHLCSFFDDFIGTVRMSESGYLPTQTRPRPRHVATGPHVLRIRGVYELIATKQHSRNVSVG